MSNNRIPQEIIDKVASQPIEEVVKQYVSLKKRGVNYIGLCPFHDDSAPSFYVSPAKGVCKCFSCGEGANVISFVQKYENVSYPVAIRRIAKQFGIDVPEVEMTDAERAKEQSREAMFIALDATNKQFLANMEQSQEAKNYIYQQRVLSFEIVQKFELGYASNDNQLTRLLPNKGYSTSVLLSAGILYQDERGQVYDRFRDRLIFPFHDVQGRVIGYTGRALSVANQAKYMNSPNTDLYNKSEFIYGLYQARKEISRSRKLYIVEGQMDVISMHQNGLENVIACSGTAFTDEQARILNRYADIAVVIGDGDKAGLEASIRQIKMLLSYGFEVRAFALSPGMDPDDLAKKLKSDLAKKLNQGEKAFDEYLFEILGIKDKKKEERIRDLETICELVSVIPDKLTQDEYIRDVGKRFGVNSTEVRSRLSVQKELKIKNWLPGFHGIEEAKEILDGNPNMVCELCFDKEYFTTHFSNKALIYAHGLPSADSVQDLRMKISKLNVLSHDDISSFSKFVNKESEALEALKRLFKEKVDICLDVNIFEHADPKSEAEETKDAFKETISFCDFYIKGYESVLNSLSSSTDKAGIVARCVEVIAGLDQLVREVVLKDYAKQLGSSAGALAGFLKPHLDRKKSEHSFMTEGLGDYTEVITDINEIPKYVTENKDLSKNLSMHGWYPLLDARTKRYVSYVMRNGSSGSSLISNFYIEPLLHVYNKDDDKNKRVLRLIHRDSKLDRIVEIRSSMLANFNELDKKLVSEGNYNFECTPRQYLSIRPFIMGNCQSCTELEYYGYQSKEGFFAFSNGIYHQVENKETKEMEWKMDLVDEMGIVEHEGVNYYLPVYSSIYANDRTESDEHEHIRYLRYKEIPEEKKLSFEQWADLMNRVYKLNDNGKWAILFAIATTFRDYVMDKKRFFTAPFFTGNTTAGKSQIAESIRHLFVDSSMPVFNLNAGTYASLFMVLEKMANVPLVIEEYDEINIDPKTMQAMKAAVYDGVGRTKVADTAKGTVVSSRILGAIVLAGQYAPVGDDGSLANRTVMLVVPQPANGAFTKEERELLNQLKSHERVGLCNILLDILKLRPMIEKHYLEIFEEEVESIREATHSLASNTDGFSRILNTVSLMTATCKFIETHTDLKLPFSYAEFRVLAEDKVLTQLSQIASTNKIADFFSSIDSLIDRGIIMKNRDYRIVETGEVTIHDSSNKGEKVDMPDSGFKVLYLNLNSIHPLYQKEFRERAISRTTLENSFASNDAYIGKCRQVRFNWEEVAYARGKAYAGGELSTNANMQMIPKSKFAPAHLFKYDPLSKSYSIDLERELIEEPVAEEGDDVPF